MDTKKFDVIGIGHPCVDYLAHIDSLPALTSPEQFLTAAGSAVGKFPPGLLQLPAVGCPAL